MRKMVLSILVDNTAGVLSRISGLFSRRGYNIDSLTVATTEKQEYSRMTVVARGDEQILEQISKQLAKLEDVREIKELTGDDSVCRELVMVKVAASRKDRQAIIATSNIFRAKVVDISTDSMMIELTGNQSKVDAFINLLGDVEILEMVRTGVTGLPRGTGDMSELFED